MAEIITHEVTTKDVLDESHINGATITEHSTRLDLAGVTRYIERASARLNVILAERGFNLGDLPEHPDAYSKIQQGIIKAAVYQVDRKFGMSGESTEQLRRDAEALEHALTLFHRREMGSAEPECDRRRRRVIGKGFS